MFTIRVMPDEADPYEVTVGARQVMAWEERDRNNTLARLNADPKLSDFYCLAHMVAKSKGQFGGDLPDFKESVDIEVLSPDQEASGPTRPGR